MSIRNRLNQLSRDLLTKKNWKQCPLCGTQDMTIMSDDELINLYVDIGQPLPPGLADILKRDSPEKYQRYVVARDKVIETLLKDRQADVRCYSGHSLSMNAGQRHDAKG